MPTFRQFFNRRMKWEISPLPNGIQVDLWQTFQLSAITAAELEANDNNNATWIVDNDLGYISTSSSAERTTISPVNGVQDTGTLGVARVYTTTALEFLQCNLAADHDNISLGFWFQFTSNPSNNHILIRAQNNSGSDALDAITFRSSTRFVGWSSAGNSNGTALTAGTWYWITVQYNRNTTSYLRVYDTSGVLVGSEATATAPNITARKFFLFNYNSETSEASTISYVDDLVMDYTDWTFPLGP